MQTSNSEESMQVASNLSSKKSPENIDGNPLKLLAWCSFEKNMISVADIVTNQMYANFADREQATHVKEITNTGLLVSLNHAFDVSANMQIFDVSKKEKVQKVFSFEEIEGVTGCGDVTYNPRRSILGAMSLSGKIAYHLFNIGTNVSKTDDTVAKLWRKSKWPSICESYKDNWMSGLDFDPNGELIAMIDMYGVFVISDVNTNDCNFWLHMNPSRIGDIYGRCRWSTDSGDPFVYIKYDYRDLNVLDVEKRALLLKSPVRLNDACISLEQLVI